MPACFAAACGRGGGETSPLPTPSAAESPLGVATTGDQVFLPYVRTGDGAVALAAEPTLTPTPPKATDTPAPTDTPQPPTPRRRPWPRPSRPGRPASWACTWSGTSLNSSICWKPAA
ncbi:MAG: hypothetical protein H6644_16360 [Caldilineaceae bacterium]|nr:hypothetical protein [Caldilineaceae bacterium]